MFLALKKVDVQQYDDSDSKPGVGVSTEKTVATPGRSRSFLSGGNSGLARDTSSRLLDEHFLNRNGKINKKIAKDGIQIVFPSSSSHYGLQNIFQLKYQ